MESQYQAIVETVQPEFSSFQRDREMILRETKEERQARMLHELAVAFEQAFGEKI